MQKLNLDMLENVSGGVITESTELYLDEAIGDIKKKLSSKEEVRNYVMNNYDSFIGNHKEATMGEVIDYINTYWDFL